MLTIRRWKSLKKKYGFTLNKIALMYGLTYYKVWMLHSQDELSEYIATHSPVEKSK